MCKKFSLRSIIINSVLRINDMSFQTLTRGKCPRSSKSRGKGQGGDLSGGICPGGGNVRGEMSVSQENYPGSVASYDTRPGNEVGLFYNGPEPHGPPLQL